jgi:hypothetical protein
MSLENIKVGDTVLINGSTITKVTRLTKTLIIVELTNSSHSGKYESKFRRATGRKSGDWATDFLRVATDEELKAVRAKNKHYNLSAKLHGFNFRTLDIETLDKINALIQ